MPDSNTTASTTTSDFDIEVEVYIDLIKRCADNAVEYYENGDLIMSLAATRNARTFINELNDFALDVAHGRVA